MKAIIKNIALLLATALFTCSCISKKNYANRMSTWEGHDVNTLISSWGPPADVYTMPNGNIMYTWLYTSDGYVTTRYNEYLDQIQQRSVTNYCKTTFTADENDVVVNWRFQGDACVSFK